MQILIIAVGKIKDKYLEDGIAEYSKRLRPYLKLKILELGEEKRTSHLTPSDQKRIREAEGIRILGSIPSGKRCHRTCRTWSSMVERDSGRKPPPV